MDVLHFTPTKFFAHLELYGAKKIADYSEDDIVVFEKNGKKVPVQTRSAYYPCYVIKICDALDVKHPPAFDKVAKQLKQAAEMSRNQKK